MSGATFALIVNMSLALLVAAAFLALSRMETKPGVRLFAASYAIGSLTPLSELLVRLSPSPAIFEFTSFASFSLAFHVMAAGLARYYRLPLIVWLLPASFALSLLGRLVLWRAPRGLLLYDLLYQLPFSLALGICTAIVAIAAPARPLCRVLTLVFGLAALHFLAKPFLSVMLGAGATARDYVDSRYALVSQSMTAVFVVAVALSLILVVVMDMLDESRAQADQDELSGLANRRAFDRDGEALLRAQSKAGRSCAALMFDLDWFKSINDLHGHSVGDQVIRAFAGVLKQSAPAGTLLGRVGGEEFVMVLPVVDGTSIEALAAQVRAQFGQIAFTGEGGTFRASSSCGIAWSRPDETLHELMIRCDRALYRAKADGRDRASMVV